MTETLIVITGYMHNEVNWVTAKIGNRFICTWCCIMGCIMLY